MLPVPPAALPMTESSSPSPIGASCLVLHRQLGSVGPRINFAGTAGTSEFFTFPWPVRCPGMGCTLGGRWNARSARIALYSCMNYVGLLYGLKTEACVNCTVVYCIKIRLITVATVAELKAVIPERTHTAEPSKTKKSLFQLLYSCRSEQHKHLSRVITY